MDYSENPERTLLNLFKNNLGLSDPNSITEKRSLRYTDYESGCYLFQANCLEVMDMIASKHPTQKPVALLKRCIEASTKAGDFILDPFSGSSTTGDAALGLDRKFCGIELEDSFIDLSIKRLKDSICKTHSVPMKSDSAFECNMQFA